MSSSTREEVLRHLNTVGQLQPALHKQTHAPAPTEIDHTLFRAYTRTPHDVGGEPDVPIVYHEKEEEVWELNKSVVASRTSTWARRCTWACPITDVG